MQLNITLDDIKADTKFDRPILAKGRSRLACDFVVPTLVANSDKIKQRNTVMVNVKIQ